MSVWTFFFKEKKKKICIGRLKEFQLFSTVETGGFLTRIIAVSCDLLTCVPLCRAGAWPFRSSFVKRPVNRLSGAAAAPEHFSSPSGGAPESLTFDIHLAGRMCRYFRWRQKRRNIWLPKNLKKWKHLLSVSTGVFKTDLRYNMVINRVMCWKMFTSVGKCRPLNFWQLSAPRGVFGWCKRNYCWNLSSLYTVR